jgi:hypothetical protein
MNSSTQAQTGHHSANALNFSIPLRVNSVSSSIKQPKMARKEKGMRPLYIPIAFGLILISPGFPLADQPDQHLIAIPSHPWFTEVLAASVVGWVIGKVKGYSGTQDWLEGYWEHPPGWAVWILDCAVFVGVGGFFGTGIYNPTSFLSAIAAGFTWPIGLGSLATKDQ